MIHPGKEQDSLKNATYSFTLDVIAIPKEEQKVKTFVDLTKLMTAKFIISQQKNLRKSGRSSLSLLRIKKF